MSTGTPPLACALAGVVDGDLAQLPLVIAATHDELRSAAACIPALSVGRSALLRAIRDWRAGRYSDSEMNLWALFLRGGFVPFRSTGRPLHAIEFKYDPEHEDLLVSVLARIGDLGDRIDGAMDGEEIDAVLSALEC